MKRGIILAALFNFFNFIYAEPLNLINKTNTISANSNFVYLESKILNGVEEPNILKNEERQNILVLLFHNVEKKPSSKYSITSEQFYATLELLYKEGFSPASIDDLVRGEFDIPVGKKPVIITVDDFFVNRLFIETYEKFSKEHPDFTMKATFFVTGDSLFLNKKNIDQIRDLVKSYKDKGITFASHTFSHANLTNKNLEFVKKEIEILDSCMEQYGMDKAKYFAYPYGNVPHDEEVKNYLMNRFEACFLANDEICRRFSNKFNIHEISRVDCSNLDYLRLIIEYNKNKFYIKK